VLRGRRRRKRSMLRALRWLALVPLASRVPMYSRLVWALAIDPRVPAGRKAVLVGAAGYVLLGRDLVPDDIPLLGGIDDLAVVVLAFEVFFDGIPEEIIEEKIAELEIDGEAFRRDLDYVRRLTPAPIRKIIHRLPEAMDIAGRFVSESGIGPRVKSWVNKEETSA
jgi:uncharacterized membrane protein YkvA (DUF1232 family)